MQSIYRSLVERTARPAAFRRTRPQIIRAPDWKDVHPDHTVACKLVDAARFWAQLSRPRLTSEASLGAVAPSSSRRCSTTSAIAIATGIGRSDEPTGTIRVARIGVPGLSALL